MRVHISLRISRSKDFKSRHSRCANKSDEAITPTKESYENVVCQAALEQEYEIEYVDATEGINFLCKLRNLSLQNLLIVKIKRNCYLGYNMYATLICF